MAKYSRTAGKKVAAVMHEMKGGKLKAGSGKKVTSPKQAIATGLYQAPEAGARAPGKATSKTAAKETLGAKADTKKTAIKKPSAAKAVSRKAAPKKAASRKATN